MITHVEEKNKKTEQALRVLEKKGLRSAVFEAVDTCIKKAGGM